MAKFICIEEKKEEEKSEDSLLDHSFIYKGFLDEDHFKTKLKDEFTLITQDGMNLKDMKVSTKIQEVYSSQNISKN